MAFLLTSALLLQPVHAYGADPSPPAFTVPPVLAIAELKMTGDEFVVLQNNTGSAIPDLSRYWLQYFNNTDPLSPGVKSSAQQLPAGALPTGSAILLSATGRATCGAAMADSLSFSLGDSAGFLQVVQYSAGTNGAVVPSTFDMVSWGQTSGNIHDIPSKTDAKANAVWYRYQTTGNNGDISFAWQQAVRSIDPAAPCLLAVPAVSSGSTVPINWQWPESYNVVPGRVVSLAASEMPESADGPQLPPSDIGLKAPLISEILPNPGSNKSDDEDEFIELYNPNPVPFDLTGFALQVGITTLHTYRFPADTTLPALSFQAFFSIDSGINMSNSSGQARLLDPFGTIISSTDPYGTAKDDQAWAKVDGTWYWTLSPTPNAPNLVNQAVAGSAKQSAGTKPKTSASPATVKGASISNIKTAAPASGVRSEPGTVSIHPATLATVAALALLYGVYEYRGDMANYFHKFRQHRENRRNNR